MQFRQMINSYCFFRVEMEIAPLAPSHMQFHTIILKFMGNFEGRPIKLDYFRHVVDTEMTLTLIHPNEILHNKIFIKEFWVA